MDFKIGLVAGVVAGIGYMLVCLVVYRIEVLVRRLRTRKWLKS
jgi:hypothetical protein